MSQSSPRKTKAYPGRDAQSSRSERPRPRITRLGSFRVDEDTDMMLIPSATSRIEKSEKPSQDTKEYQEERRMGSSNKTRPPKRLAELDTSRSIKTPSTPPPSPRRPSVTQELSPFATDHRTSTQEEKSDFSHPHGSSSGRIKQKRETSQKPLPGDPVAGESARRQISNDQLAGYRAVGSSGKQREVHPTSKKSRSSGSQEASRPLARPRMDRATAISMPARSFYAPGTQPSQSIARIIRRALGAGPNALFPMFAGRPCIAAGRGTRVELHVHLEGCLRYTTIWELMKTKKLPLPGDGSVEAVREAIVVREPVSPRHFFGPVGVYLQCIIGDLNALERVAYEFCEDKVREGVLYAEVRYSPHMLMVPKHFLPRGKIVQELGEIVMAINRGFRVGEREFGIVVRSILALVAGWGNGGDIINLVQQFQDDGVVGIDLHMPYESDKKELDEWTPTMATEEVPLSRDELKAFGQAVHLGISRTVHAGLLGSAYMVQRGIEKYRAQRIGHGYEVLKLPHLYDKSKERNVHFECCPWMSVLTCSVDPTHPKHPIARFAEDGMNFSLNTSHPTISNLTLQEEYDLVTSWGLTEFHLVRSNINAMRSSFLNPSEKSHMMQTLLENIGLRRRSKTK